MKGTEALKAILEQKREKKTEKKPWGTYFFGTEVFNFTLWPHLDQSLATAAIIRGQSLRVLVRALVVITTVKVCSLPTFHLLSCQMLPPLPRTVAVKGPVCKIFKEARLTALNQVSFKKKKNGGTRWQWTKSKTLIALHIFWYWIYIPQPRTEYQITFIVERVYTFINVLKCSI